MALEDVVRIEFTIFETENSQRFTYGILVEELKISVKENNKLVANKKGAAKTRFQHIATLADAILDYFASYKPARLKEAIPREAISLDTLKVSGLLEQLHISKSSLMDYLRSILISVMAGIGEKYNLRGEYKVYL